MATNSVGQKSSSEILYDALYSLFKRKYIVAAVFVCTFIAIVFGTFLVTPQWKATAKVRVQYNPKQQLTMFQGVTTPGQPVAGVNPANDVVEILTSRELAESVAKKFHRDQLWDKRTNAPGTVRERIRWHVYDFLIAGPMRFLQRLGILTDAPDNYLAMAVDELQDDLTDIELQEDTTVVSVSVWGESPAIATDLSNEYVRLLLQENLEASKAPVEKMIGSAADSLKAAEIKLRSAQDAVKHFKETSHLVQYDEEASLLLKNLDAYNTQVREMRGTLASLKSEKGENHPEVKSLVAKIDEYQEVFIPTVEKRLAVLPAKEVELARLNWNLDIEQKNVSMWQQKLTDLEALKGSSNGDLELKVIDPAKVYSNIKPDWPRWVVTIPLALIAGLAASLFIALFLEYWTTAPRSVKELEEMTEQPVLGAVPGVKGPWALARWFRAMSGQGQRVGRRLMRAGTSAFDRLSEIVLLQARGRPAQFLAVTSAGQGEGKTSVAAGLGICLAQRGKRVLLLETNARDPAVHRLLGTRGHERGFCEYCAGAAALEDIVYQTEGPDIIHAGDSADPGQAFEMLGSPAMGRLIEQARQKYDFILADTACLKRFRDPLALTGWADGFLVVVRAEQTPSRAIRMAVDRITEGGGKVFGLVLNGQRNCVPEFLRDLLQ